MAWTYKQSTGQMFDPDGKLAGVGYSGYGTCKNDPMKQDVPHEGPIPRGNYLIMHPFYHQKLGPWTMILEPDLHNQMFGRSLFRIHGYGKDDPETEVDESQLSSHGCICIPLITRMEIGKSNDHLLQVIL